MVNVRVELKFQIYWIFGGIGERNKKMIKLFINRCIAKDYLYLFIYNDYVTGSTGKKRKVILNIANSRLNFVGSSISINICQTRSEIVF